MEVAAGEEAVAGKEHLGLLEELQKNDFSEQIILSLSSEEISMLRVREAIVVWEKAMNQVVKDLAKKTWGDEWLRKCKSCVSSCMREKMDDNIESPWDLYKIFSICVHSSKIFFPPNASDDRQELHR